MARRGQILLTFDHELHLGGVRSYRQNLFDPTDHLLDLAREIDAPLNLFTDVLCGIRYRDWDRRGFYEPYRAQLARALTEGHDIQLHLHPHWLDTGFRDGRFVPSPRFALSDFVNEPPPHDIDGIVRMGRDFLLELGRSVDPAYECVAYRAGGYNLMPATREILTALHANGIRIDSTIAKGYRFRSELSDLDYRRMPPDANWWIDPEGPLDRPARDGIFEVPIAARPLTPASNVPYRIRQAVNLRTIKRRRYDSGGYMIHAGKNTSRLDKLRELAFPTTVIMLGFDSATFGVSDMMGILEHHLRTHRHAEEIVVSAISHPKVMGAYHRDVMAGFVRSVRERYGDDACFITFAELARQLGVTPGGAER